MREYKRSTQNWNWQKHSKKPQILTFLEETANEAAIVSFPDNNLNPRTLN